MERYSKLGLPVLVGGLLLFIFAMKSFVNIGYGEAGVLFKTFGGGVVTCLLYASPSPRDSGKSRMPSSA